MFSVLRRPTVAWSRVMRGIQQGQRLTIYSKPAKEKIGPVQSAFTLCVFALSLLAPAGWIMLHIPDYRQKPPRQN